MKGKFVLLVVLAVAAGVTTGLAAAHYLGEPPVPAQGLEEELFAGAKWRGSQQGPPRIRVEGASHDFGEQLMPTGGMHTLIIFNEGKGPLEVAIRSIEGKCRINRQHNQPSIPPGESETITIYWLPPPQPGKVQLRLELQTNDPLRPKIPVSISGKITGFIRAKPSSLSFQLRQGETASQTVRVLAPGFKQLPIHRLRLAEGSDKPCFRAELMPLGDSPYVEDGGFQAPYRDVRVEVVPDLPPGKYRDRLEIYFTPHTPPTVIPLQLEVLGTFRVVGAQWEDALNRFRFGRIPQKQGRTFQLTVLGSGQEAAKARLEVKEVFPQFVQVELGSREKIPQKKDRWRWLLKVRVPKGAPLGAFPANPSGPTGRIVLKTTHPEQPSLEIPFSFAVVP